MQPNRLFSLVREELLEREDDSTQRELIAHFLRPLAMIPFSGAHDVTVDGMMDALTRVYADAQIRVRTYCELIACLNLFKLRAASRSIPELSIYCAYIHWALMDKDVRDKFGAAMRADMAHHGQPHFNHSSSSPEEDSDETDPLGNLLQTMVRAAINDGGIEEIRQFVLWCHSAYQPYHRRLLEEPGSDSLWLQRLCEFIPWLMMKNFIPLRDTVQHRSPQIAFMTGKSASDAHGMTDSGRLTRRSTLARNLFKEDKLAVLDREDQRICELFAHAYANFMHEDHGASFKALEQKLRGIATENRLAALQCLETHFRYKLTIPRNRYLALKNSLSATQDVNATVPHPSSPR